VYRLDLADGRRVRMRVFPTTAAAAEVWRHLCASEASVLPRPLFQAGRALVVEYVEGVPLDRYLRRAEPGLEARLVRAAGRLLARLHGGSMVRGSALRPAEYGRFLTRVSRRLARKGLFDAESAARLARLPVPASAPAALTHGDVCPENLILTPEGRLRAIDEERLAVRPIAFELARTVSRWPLRPELEAGLLAAYTSAGGDARSYRRDRVFWLATALATSAAYRVRFELPGASAVIARLQVLVAGE
jgi:aminoglycoside phosphotransferase (APT) family kinase protein